MSRDRRGDALKVVCLSQRNAAPSVPWPLSPALYCRKIGRAAKNSRRGGVHIPCDITPTAQPSVFTSFFGAIAR